MFPQGHRSAQLPQPMQVRVGCAWSLIVTTSESDSRVMAPVGQSTMQVGSVHW